MSTDVPGFQSFFRFFASFCIGQISHPQQKGFKNTYGSAGPRPRFLGSRCDRHTAARSGYTVSFPDTCTGLAGRWTHPPHLKTNRLALDKCVSSPWATEKKNPLDHLCTKTLVNYLLSNVWLFSCDNCLHAPKVLFSWFSLYYLYLSVPIYQSTICAQTDNKQSTKIFVNHLCTNVRLTICAQMFQCANSAQDHSLTNIPANRWPKYSSTLLTSVISWCVYHVQWIDEPFETPEWFVKYM